MSITSAPARDNSSRNSDARVQRGIGLGKKRTKKGNDKSKFQSEAEALPRSSPKLNAIIIIECNQPLHMRINDNREKSRFTKLALTHERAILTLRGLQRQIAPVVRKQRANIARITINNQLGSVDEHRGSFVTMGGGGIGREMQRQCVREHFLETHGKGECANPTNPKSHNKVSSK